MLQYQWVSVNITKNSQVNNMLKLFNELKPEVGAFDTETDGLHIIFNKPFLFQFGFLHPTELKGYTYTVDLERYPNLGRGVIKTWNRCASKLKIYLGHNIKFDLHMLTNIGLPYTTENMSDTMFYIRYAHDAIATKNGGPPLKLKEYAQRYIEPKAKRHETLLDRERSEIAKEINIKLAMRLKHCGRPPEKYGRKTYTLSVIKEMFKDPIMTAEDLPEEIRGVYYDWLRQDVPLYLQKKVTRVVEPEHIPYDVLNRENLTRYGHYDIIYTLEIYAKLKPIVENRLNTRGVEIENALILPLWEMERVGFKVNKLYIARASEKLKSYIQRQRNLFLNLCGGVEIKIGQHALIKETFTKVFGIPIETTNAEELQLLHSTLLRNQANPDAIKFIEVLQELRTLEKWYSTYIVRFLKELNNTDRLYTTIHQVGTVSGRVTSDFQQFPKGGITTTDGEELFTPRKMIEATGGEYPNIVYLDYSQIELRFQALYTILVGDPDLNLCRAYMPYKCVDKNGTPFDYNNPEHIKDWHKEWYYEEDTSKHWDPTDVHGATTTAATGLQKGDPDFDDFRSKVGKRTNFAKNYGATWSRIRSMFPDKTNEEITKINDAYYIAFPGVKSYHEYCKTRALHFSYTSNLFDVKYYGVSGHKLINLLIQGSAAYFLKLKIRELYDFCKARNVKTRWQMQIHDELSWERHISDDAQIFFEFKRIMEDWKETLIPIVADMEVTKTTWKAKKGVDDIVALQNYLSFGPIRKLQ